MNPLVYLASPYSHPDPRVKHARYLTACRVAGRLMKEGWRVFAPIPHSVAIEEHFYDGRVEGHHFWLDQDFAILRHCARVMVIRIDGWDESKGVAAEIDLAQRIGIPVEYIDP